MATQLANQPAQHVLVTGLASFPMPVAGVITLENNHSYLVSGTVDISPNRIVCGTRNSILGTDRLNDILTSDTTGALLTVGSGNLSLVCNSLTLTAANGSTFAVTSAGLAVSECSPKGATLGTFTNAGNVTFRACGFFNAFTVGGATFTGTCTGLRVVDDTVTGTAAGTLFDLGTCVFGSIHIGRNAVLTNVGCTFLSGTTGGANVTNGAVVNANVFSGAGTYVATILPDDPGWIFSNNFGISNTAVGNAATATALQTPRTINGVAFDGTANISITAAAADPSYAPGSFTVATGTGRLHIKRLQLTTTQRATLAGTARLRMT